MVSFQCDGCQDVVKKPKLDAHGSRCHASFTCIDCSKTFAGPAQWKSHTSCMSEEQKYHKSVYQEPRGRGRGRGQRGGRGGARGSGRPSYAGSGENSIPLGPQVNAWTAPPPDPVNNAPFNPSDWTGADAQPNAPLKDTPVESEPEPKSESEKKPKKSKKRKAEEEEPITAATESAGANEPAKKKKKKVEEATSTPDSSDPASEQKDKKKKKSRKSETTEADSNTADVTVEESTRKDKKKKDRKSKESSKEEVSADVTPTADFTPAPASVNGAATNGDSIAKTNGTDEFAPKKKSPKSKNASDETAAVAEEPSTNGLDGQEKKKKDKKNKKNKDVDAQPSIGPTESAAIAVDSQTEALNDADLIPVSTIEAVNGTTKKEKKSKKEKNKGAIPIPDVSIVSDPAPDASPAAESELPSIESKKSKKRKSHGEAVNGSEIEVNGTAADGAKEKSKKKSKRRDKESTEATT